MGRPLPRPLLIAAASLFTAAAAAQTAAPPAAAARFEPCDACHEEVTNAFAANPHAAASPSPLAHRLATAARQQGRDPAAAPEGGTSGNLCESCHGDGTAHAEEGDPTLILRPSRVEHDAICASCHGGSGPHRRTVISGLRSEPHPAAGVACVSCHRIHPIDTHTRPLLARPVDDLCASCHQAERAAFRRPYAHRLGRGGMSCVSCHDPHSRSERASLKRSDSGDETPCVGCHAETRGPFVFEHVAGMEGGCVRCHEPHGSTNPKRLVRATMFQLCLECHSTLIEGTLGSTPPSFHDLRSPRYRQCTVCHVAVHGSNSSPALLK